MTTTIVERVDMTQKAKTPPLWSCKHRLNISVFCCRGGRQAGRGSHTVTNHWKARAQKRNESNALTRVGHVHVLTGSYRDCSTCGKNKHTQSQSQLCTNSCVFSTWQPSGCGFKGCATLCFQEPHELTKDQPTYLK